MKGERKHYPPGKRVRFLLERAALTMLAWLVPLFPRRFIRQVGCALGTLVYWLAPTLRSISRQNLDVAFGATKSPAEKRRIARTSLANAGGTLATLFWSPRLTRDQFAELVEVDESSLQTMRAAYHRGTGLIAITPHYGDWELLGQAMGFLDMPLTVVQEAMPNESLEGIFARLRGVSGNQLVPNRFAGMTLLKTLKRRGRIAMLVDMNAGRKRGGMWLEFFGLPVHNHAGVGALALHTGAAIVAGLAYPLPNGRMRLVLGPEIRWTRTGNDEADIRAINQACLKFCEDAIRERPEYWLWCYKRWKNRPSPELGRYPAYSRHLAE
jgi:KDO2-lipid IV(A) lauroyltransferase